MKATVWCRLVAGILESGTIKSGQICLFIASTKTLNYSNWFCLVLVCLYVLFLLFFFLSLLVELNYYCYILSPTNVELIQPMNLSHQVPLLIYFTLLYLKASDSSSFPHQVEVVVLVTQPKTCFLREINDRINCLFNKFLFY